MDPLRTLIRWFRITECVWIFLDDFKFRVLHDPWSSQLIDSVGGMLHKGVRKDNEQLRVPLQCLQVASRGKKEERAMSWEFDCSYPSSARVL